MIQEVITANNGDRFTTDRLFSPNASAWLVSFPHQETVSDKNGSRREAKFHYDGGLLSPTKGDLTHETRYFDTENKDITTEYTYDTFGNRTSVKDPLGNVTRFKYDNTFNSFQSKLKTRSYKKKQKPTGKKAAGSAR